MSDAEFMRQASGLTAKDAEIARLESQNQAFQERAEKAEARLRLDRLHGMVLQERIDDAVKFLVQAVADPDPNWPVWAFQLHELLSPTQETDPE